MKRSFEIKLFKEGELGKCYTVKYLDSKKTEAELFEINVKDRYETHFMNIQTRLKYMLDRHFFKEPFLKLEEGKREDNVVAIPTKGDGKKNHGLRWYSLRMNNNILILGNGNMKSTNTYQEDEELHSYVKDLQFVDKCISKRLDNDLHIDLEDHRLVGDLSFSVDNFKEIEYPID